MFEDFQTRQPDCHLGHSDQRRTAAGKMDKSGICNEDSAAFDTLVTASKSAVNCAQTISIRLKTAEGNYERDKLHVVFKFDEGEEYKDLSG